MEAIQVLRAAGGDPGDEFLRRDAGFFGGDHDRRAMGVVGADEMDLVALHSLEPHPDVGLDIFHDVADVESAVGVGQGGGDEKLAGLCGAHVCCRVFWNKTVILAAESVNSLEMRYACRAGKPTFRPRASFTAD